MDIKELLHRRSDLSTFLVHFTRDLPDGSRARANLLSILRDRKLEARNPFGMARQYAMVKATQRTVCFTETPLEHAWMMCKQIDGRSFEFNGYGLAFTKTFARRRGTNPVWYLDTTPGHDWLINPIKRLIGQAFETAATPSRAEFDSKQSTLSDILRLTPFLEQMGTTNNTRKEFWWEREWRHVGDLRFDPTDIVVVFAPEPDHECLRAEVSAMSGYASRKPALVDAGWGLERMIGALADVQDLGPFP